MSSRKQKRNDRLERFLKAQKESYHSAYAEIASGEKTGHWIWYIFPQLAGLGSSATSQQYVIADLAEACAYLKEPTLFSHYLAMVELVNAQLEKGIPIDTLMGTRLDAKKLASSLTLFNLAAQHLSNEETANESFHALAACTTEVLNKLSLQGHPPCRITKAKIGIPVSSVASSSAVSTQKPAPIPMPTPAPMPTRETLTTPMPKNNTALQMIITTLIKNINDKRNRRTSWFTLNTENKIEKLNSILQWISTHPMDESKMQLVLVLVRDICAIKRNILGLFEPHSLQEFKDLVSKQGLNPPPHTIYFKGRELATISNNPNTISELIEKKNLSLLSKTPIKP